MNPFVSIILIYKYFPKVQPYCRSTISYDNIDYLSEKLANFNKYIPNHIKDWCRQRRIIANNAENILRPNDRDFKSFVNAVTSRRITRITLTPNIQEYQQIFRIFPNHNLLVNFMKFILGLTLYLLNPSSLTHLEDVYPFIGITYFIYNKMDHSQLFVNADDKALILQDIRNLWTIFLFKKTNSHTNLGGEWDILFRETRHPNPLRVDLTPAFNIIDYGSSRTSIPLSLYIEQNLIPLLDIVIAI